MHYHGVTSRFMFWNGKDQYTVEFTHATDNWYVFNNEENRDCVYKKEKEKRRDNEITIVAAREILDEFFNEKTLRQ